MKYLRDTPALLQNCSVSHYWGSGPGLAHLTQWLFHAHYSLLWRRYSSTTERASWTPARNAPALPLPSWSAPAFQSKRKLLRRLWLSSPLTFSFVGMRKQERWRWEQDQKEWHVYYELMASTHHNDISQMLRAFSNTTNTFILFPESWGTKQQAFKCK